MHIILKLNFISYYLNFLTILYNNCYYSIIYVFSNFHYNLMEQNLNCSPNFNTFFLILLWFKLLFIFYHNYLNISVLYFFLFSIKIIIIFINFGFSSLFRNNICSYLIFYFVICIYFLLFFIELFEICPRIWSKNSPILTHLIKKLNKWKN